MKFKTKTSTVKSMAAKKIAYSEAADAIKNKLEEIKQDHRSYKANIPSLALFGQNPFQAIPPVHTNTSYPQAKVLRGRTASQLALF